MQFSCPSKAVLHNLRRDAHLFEEWRYWNQLLLRVSIISSDFRLCAQRTDNFTHRVFFSSRRKEILFVDTLLGFVQDPTHFTLKNELTQLINLIWVLSMCISKALVRYRKFPRLFSCGYSHYWHFELKFCSQIALNQFFDTCDCTIWNFVEMATVIWARTMDTQKG